MNLYNLISHYTLQRIRYLFVCLRLLVECTLTLLLILCLGWSLLSWGARLPPELLWPGILQAPLSLPQGVEDAEQPNHKEITSLLPLSSKDGGIFLLAGDGGMGRGSSPGASLKHPAFTHRSAIWWQARRSNNFCIEEI